MDVRQLEEVIEAYYEEAEHILVPQVEKVTAPFSEADVQRLEQLLDARGDWAYLAHAAPERFPLDADPMGIGFTFLQAWLVHQVAPKAAH